MVVIGGGNTAIDAANAARRLGAQDVHLFYRRTEKEMPAFSVRVRSLEGGRRAVSLAGAAGGDYRAGGARGRRCGSCDTTLGEPDAVGRRKAEPVPGSEFDFACDMVIPALGQSRLTELLQETRGIDVQRGLDRGGSRDRAAPGNPKYYAGGDCVNGGREVVDAVADGKRAARCAIAAQLGGGGHG